MALSSVDGGQSWQSHHLPASISTDALGSSPSCPTDTQCWVSILLHQDQGSPQPVIAATTDGGQAWQQDPVNDSCSPSGCITNIQALQCPVSSTCLALGDLRNFHLPPVLLTNRPTTAPIARRHSCPTGAGSCPLIGWQTLWYLTHSGSPPTVLQFRCLKYLLSLSASAYSSSASPFERFALGQRFDLSFDGELLLSVEASIPQSGCPGLLQFLIAETPAPERTYRYREGPGSRRCSPRFRRTWLDIPPRRGRR